VNRRVSKALRSAVAIRDDRQGFSESTKERHKDDGVSSFRGIAHRVYQREKRLWKSRHHQPAGGFTGSRRPCRVMSEEAVVRGEAQRFARAQIMRAHPELNKQPWRPMENLLRQVEAMRNSSS